MNIPATSVRIILSAAVLAAGGATTALIVSGANAQEMLTNDPRRQVIAVSAELGVTPVQFVACFRSVHPAPKGTAPSEERRAANKAVLLGCLQQANPTITNDALDAVMDKYRPEGRVAGR